MKKVLRFLALVMCATLLISLVACNGPRFMSSSKVKKLVQEFGLLQAEMTLSFSSNNKKMKYVITYDLLLDKAPITVINFINLVNEGHYNDAILDSFNSSGSYYTGGRYAYRADDEDKKKVLENNSGIQIPGEFKSNGYNEPEGGYAEFFVFALAMNHTLEQGKDNSENFNDANGALIFSVASTESGKALNYTNYAVFAKMSSISIYSGDDETPIATYDDKIGSTYLKQFTDLTSTTSCTVTTGSGDSKSVQILGSSQVPRFIFNIRMLGDKDWSKLPKVN